MSLPLLPGNTFSSNPGRENFSKSHHFDVCNAINMNVGEYKVSDLRTHYYPRLPILWTKKDGRGFWTGYGSLIKPGIGGEILPGQKFKQHSIYPPGEGEPAPAWITFDRQVLSFDAYFHEMVVPTGTFPMKTGWKTARVRFLGWRISGKEFETRIVNMEKHRIRYVKIYFYLEDDSIQVIEPTKGPESTLTY